MPPIDPSDAGGAFVFLFFMLMAFTAVIVNRKSAAENLTGTPLQSNPNPQPYEQKREI